jgi:hypothetical protein
METKDYVTLSLATVSCVLSIVTFVRLIISERRLFVEYLFKDRWKRTRVALEAHLSAVESWFCWFEKRHEDRGYIHIQGEGKIELDAIARSYAKDLARALDRYLAAVDGLTSEIKNYNRLFNVTSKALFYVNKYRVFADLPEAGKLEMMKALLWGDPDRNKAK